MREQFELRLKELTRRAGLSGVPPAALVAAFAVCLVVMCLAAWRWWPRDAASGRDSALTVQSAQDGLGAPQTASGDAGGDIGGGSAGHAADSTSTAGPVFVHVIGAIRRPGLYGLAVGARVADAVDAAGGLMANAAQAGVNLARVVSDGEQISVPTLDEFARGGAGAGAGAGGTGAAAGGASGGSAGTGAQVNINTADASALDTLPGIGPSTAAKIVADREANGPFASADDLGRVTGIGPKKLEELKPRVCVR